MIFFWDDCFTLSPGDTGKRLSLLQMRMPMLLESSEQRPEMTPSVVQCSEEPIKRYALICFSCKTVGNVAIRRLPQMRKTKNKTHTFDN